MRAEAGKQEGTLGMPVVAACRTGCTEGGSLALPLDNEELEGRLEVVPSALDDATAAARVGAARRAEAPPLREMTWLALVRLASALQIRAPGATRREGAARRLPWPLAGSPH